MKQGAIRRAVDKLVDIDARLAWDREAAHIEADKVLIELIDNPEITEAYDAIGKWYA